MVVGRMGNRPSGFCRNIKKDKDEHITDIEIVIAL
jgi:hypothetical protein